MARPLTNERMTTLNPSLGVKNVNSKINMTATSLPKSGNKDRDAISSSGAPFAIFYNVYIPRSNGDSGIANAK